jgi:Leucine-rich repeat (LRR) protein
MVLSLICLACLISPTSAKPPDAAAAHNDPSASDADFDAAYDSDKVGTFFDLARHDVGLLHEFLALRTLRPIGVWNANDKVTQRISQVATIFSLDLRGHDVTNKSLESIRNMRQLRELVLVDTSIDGEKLANLGALSRLRHLKITSSPIEEDSLQFVEKLERLEQLTLADIGISDADVRSMTTCRHLKTLFLGNVKVSDSAISDLGTMKQLKYLFLAGTDISEDGVRKLESLLPSTTITWSSRGKAMVSEK